MSKSQDELIQQVAIKVAQAKRQLERELPFSAKREIEGILELLSQSIYGSNPRTEAEIKAILED